MGAESSVLQGLQLEDPLSSSGQSDWELHPARRDDGSRMSVFVHKPTDKSTNSLENAAKQLKVLRHPTIVKFYGTYKNHGETYLLTEPVTPLELVLDSMSPQEICAGLYNIVEALSFLHDRGGVCHNNVCLSSIYVSEDGGWRLGGMQHLCRFEQATVSYLQKCKPARDEQVLSPEEKAGKVELSPEWGHVRDAYAFGVLAEQLMEFLVDLGDMTKTFELRIQDEFLNPDPKERPLMNTLLDDRLFKNEFVEIVNFLKSVTVKSEEEKKKFFSGLAKKLHQLPPTLVASRLVRPLLARFVLLDSTATECVVPHLLTPYIGEERSGEFVEWQLNPILPEPLFRTQIIPEVYKIFHVRDLHIRMVLLKHFSAFVKYFDHGTLRTVLLPQLLLGLRDVNDALAEASLRAIADLIPLLGGDIVIGPSRLRVFAEGKPKFNGLNGSISIKTRKSTPDNSVSSIVGLNKKNLRESEGSASTSDINGEKQTLKQIARQAEREKRREEAKRRSEERRKRREERNKNPIKAVLVDKAEKKNVIVEDEKVEINEQDGDAGTHDAPGDQSHDQILPAEDTEEKGDWSDWEPVAEKDTASVSSGDIDQEIENEIKKMESTLPPEAKDRLSRISASDSEVGGSADMSPEHMVLNAENLKDKKGVLRLSSGKHRASPPPARTDYTSEYESHSRVESVDKIRRQTVNSPKQTQSFDGQKDDKTVWDSHWDEDAHSSTTHQKRGLKTQSHKASASISKKIAISELGSEFDIKSLDIKTSKPSETNVLDFFAGMEPTIQKKGDIFSQFGLPLDTGSVEVDSPTVKSDKKGQDPTAKTLSFAVMDMDGQDTAGWGDDELEWGDTFDA